MNIIWSKYVQGSRTLYYSRKLRFDDAFREQFKPLFDIDENSNLKILEIGCGPGALAGALRRWYPKSEITAVDRDSEFIRFAKEHEKGITFSEGDATSLSFKDNTFDIRFPAGGVPFITLYTSEPKRCISLLISKAKYIIMPSVIYI